jgi:hypothetical protein
MTSFFRCLTLIFHFPLSIFTLVSNTYKYDYFLIGR